MIKLVTVKGIFFFLSSAPTGPQVHCDYDYVK